MSGARSVSVEVLADDLREIRALYWKDSMCGFNRSSHPGFDNVAS